MTSKQPTPAGGVAFLGKGGEKMLLEQLGRCCAETLEFLYGEIAVEDEIHTVWCGCGKEIKK